MMNHPRMRIAGIAALALITGAACVFEAVSARADGGPTPGFEIVQTRLENSVTLP